MSCKVMSKIHDILGNYSDVDVVIFNKEIEQFLELKKGEDPSNLMRAVAYFYLTLKKLEEEEHSVFKNMEGKVLTVLDAFFSDPQQRKAVKDLIKNAIRG